MSALLEIRNLQVSHGKVEALSEFSMVIASGGIVTVIGPNGAGKSTSLNAIMGVLPCKGDVLFQGENINDLSVEQRAAQGLSLVAEKRELFGSMSVEDNLILGAYTRYRKNDRTVRSTLDEIYARFPRLTERRKQLAATLSGGERQMLALGRALMAKPALIMLDEPSLGLAPRIVRDIFRIITELRSTGVSILLVEQNARAAMQVADYAYVLEMGAVSMEGPSEQVAKDPRVAKSYLGFSEVNESEQT